MTGAALDGRFNGKRALCALAMVVIATAATTCYAMGPLHEAAATGNTEFVKSWISQKRNLDVTYDEPSVEVEGNYSRGRGITALMTAARTGQFEIVKLLVEGGADLYAESRWRDGSNPRTAFDYAVDTERVAIVEYLWTKSDGIRFASRLDQHIAASCRRSCDDKFGGDARSNLALFLISIARDDAALGKGLSEAACYAQQPLRLLAFLDKHAVRFPGNTLHCIAYNPAVRHLRSVQERIAIASFFLDHGADPNDLPYTPLRGAAAAHDIEMVKFLLARGANPNLQGADGVTPMGAAANSCVYGGDAVQLEPRQKPQLAVIEYLAQAGSGAKLYATEGARSRLQILTSCCSRKPQTATQRRICELFGL
ncbi:MAG TPA: ankyrin repeat domain-containing protein [Methylomirabilota bacterium]|nr:ankyrin repeat domain-containing protein [Methylomirabilota bacterium]